MFDNNRLPKFPNSYIGDKSREYNNSKWMERNQKKTTLICIQFLYDPKLDRVGVHNNLERMNYVVLDLGCGTGFSSEILAENGFRVIGVDILKDMLYKANDKRKEFSTYNNIFLILSDINYLPIRNNSIDHIISVSAFNFTLNDLKDYGDRLKKSYTTAKYLNQILKKRGRIVIEFYPKNQMELEMFSSSFKTNNFEGFLVKSNPKQKAGQQFLLLKKK